MDPISAAAIPELRYLQAFPFDKIKSDAPLS